MYVYLGRIVEPASLPVLPSEARPRRRRATSRRSKRSSPPARISPKPHGSPTVDEREVGAETLIPTHEVALWLNVSTRTLLRWCQQCRFPPPAVGGSQNGCTKYWTLHVVLEQYKLRHEDPSYAPPTPQPSAERKTNDGLSSELR